MTNSANNSIKSVGGSNPNLVHLLEQEFNPYNVAGTPPNAFISILKQRMDCYGFDGTCA